MINDLIHKDTFGCNSTEVSLFFRDKVFVPFWSALFTSGEKSDIISCERAGVENEAEDSDN